MIYPPWNQTMSSKCSSKSLKNAFRSIQSVYPSLVQHARDWPTTKWPNVWKRYGNFDAQSPMPWSPFSSSSVIIVWITKKKVRSLSSWCSCGIHSRGLWKQQLSLLLSSRMEVVNRRIGKISSELSFFFWQTPSSVLLNNEMRAMPWKHWWHP